MRAAAGNAVVTDFLPLLWAFGADIFSPDGKPVLNSPQAIAALKFMLELGNVTPPDTPVTTQTKSQRTFFSPQRP